MKNIQFLHIYTNIYLIFLLKNRSPGYSQKYRGINAGSAPAKNLNIPREELQCLLPVSL
jgi:hypothetical protein